MSLPSRPSTEPGHLTAHRSSRRTRKGLALSLVSAVLVLGPAGTAYAAPAPAAETLALPRAAATPGGVTLQTEQPKVSEADISLIVNVRLAGLWEIPAGQMAIEKGVSPRVRQIGQMIAAQHVRLDDKVKVASAELGVEIPDKPTMQQSRWLDEMKAAKGTTFDELYVMRLRAAHGKIFPVIGSVRASTENDTVRKLAQSANDFVLTHITLLESTGLVSYEELPEAEALDLGASSAEKGQAGVLASPVIWIILATALLSGAFVTTRMVRARNLDIEDTGGYSRRGRDPMGTGSLPAQSAAGAYRRTGADRALL